MKSLWQKFFRALANPRNGIILLLVVVVLMAVGTFILQRPTSDPATIERAYSSSTLRVLDTLQLTDIYHAWYFVALLGLVCVSIVFASLDRWPKAWRYYARPYRRTEPHFRAALLHKALIPVKNAGTALEAAERAFRKAGIPVEREMAAEEVSLYSERHRIAEFAVYVVHASLLLILLGYGLGHLRGYSGFMMLPKGESSNRMTIQTGRGRTFRLLPFSIRCDDAKQENYTVREMISGEESSANKLDERILNRETEMPKQYWSELTVLEDGREVTHKRISVNHPLTYRGVRFYQSSMGASGKLDTVHLLAITGGNAESAKDVLLSPGQTVALDGGYKLALLRFVPDYYVLDHEVFTKSEEPDNPAFQLSLTGPDGKETKMWLLPSLLNMTSEDTPIKFQAAVRTTEQGAAIDMKMVPFTGLEVSYIPGQTALWGGLLLMVLGLIIVFFMAHTRYWAVVVKDQKLGPAVWVGGTTNRNRARFEQDFAELVELIKAELAGGAGKKPAETKKLVKA